MRHAFLDTPSSWLHAPLCLALVAALCGPFAAAQQPERPQQPPPALLLGNHLLDAGTLQPGPKLGDFVGRRPRIAPDGTSNLGDTLIDPARRLLLTADGEALRLVELPATARWRRPLADLALAPPPLLPQAVLTRELLVLPDQEDDLVAIALADGKPRWRDRGGEHGGLVHDDELLACFVATPAGRVARLLSLANGAKAAEVKAMPEAEFLALGPHGLIVAGAHGAVVCARTGPQLFAVAGDVHAAIGDARGFCLHVGDELLAFDAAGKERWRAPLAVQYPMQARLVALPAGEVVVLQFQGRADDGAELQAHDPERGSIVWRRRLQGLGVDHSKYWQDVAAYVRGERLVVTSHAAGGHWLALLDHRGELLARTDAK